MPHYDSVRYSSLLYEQIDRYREALRAEPSLDLRAQLKVQYDKELEEMRRQERRAYEAVRSRAPLDPVLLPAAIWLRRGIGFNSPIIEDILRRVTVTYTMYMGNGDCVEVHLRGGVRTAIRVASDCSIFFLEYRLGLVSATGFAFEDAGYYHDDNPLKRRHLP